MFAKVIVDVPEFGPLDYKVPDDMLVAVGDRVIVPLQTRLLPGVVVALVSVSDLEKKRLRSIRAVLNDSTPLREEWLRLTQFASKYYVRGWGETAIPAIPKFFRRLPKKGHLTKLEKWRQSPAVSPDMTPVEKPPLNAEQQSILEDFLASTGKGYFPALLYGVTGSGKTEVYLRMIEEVLARDRETQVLLLVPEINLTPQLEARVRARFPLEEVASLHSECTETERARIWLGAHEGRVRILIGTRLSVFSSFANLGLIIVDEEHDSSFKAHEGIYYSARDLAVWRAYYNRIPIVLGSATPSIETWYKMKKGDYRLWELTKRAVGKSTLPKLSLIPAPRGGEAAISPVAAVKIQESIDSHRQVLIFLNRRGYSPVLYCPACGWKATCEHCSSHMVFHKNLHAMVCHHCQSRKPVPRACPECGNVDILPRGLGTERLEEEVRKAFPGVRILRIDRDSVSGRSQAEKAFSAVHKGEVDVIIGTQMIAKGHDFKNVDLVVVLESDALLCHPDLKAREQLFSVLMQVSGRAGRHSEQGEVLVQTNHSTDPFYEALIHQNYREFADQALSEREREFYVPYSSQALLVATAVNIDLALGFCETVAKSAETIAGDTIRVYDPMPMSLLRLKDKERAQLLVEGDDRLSLNRFLWEWKKTFPQTVVDWSIEVDPTVI